MKCPYEVVVFKHKEIAGTTKTSHVPPGDMAGPKKGYVMDSRGPCPGHLSVKIEAVDEPYFGGCRAALEIKWFCSENNQEVNYPGLPYTDHVFEQWVNANLDNMVNTVKVADAWGEEREVPGYYHNHEEK